MRSLSRCRGGAAFVLLSVGLSLGGSAVFTDAQASAADGPATIFQTSPLLPGDTVTGHLELPTGSQPLTPYIQAISLSDGCVAGATCAPGGPKLSRTLLLTVTAPDGSTWHGTAAQLLSPLPLPGGLLPATSGSVTYGISLTVPVSLADDSEDRTFALDFQYGGMDSSNQIITSVLGETFTKGGPEGGASVLGEHTSESALPFTGAYIGLFVVAGAALVGAGALFLLVGLRRRGAPM